MSRVLLVEDQPLIPTSFKAVPGIELDAAESPAELRQLIAELTEADSSGRPLWDYAFVDFDYTPSDAPLGAPSPETGLTAMRLIRDASPHTKLIAFTTFVENGRQMYLAAAHRWFSAWAVLDKSKASEGLLLDVVRNGKNPTPPAWQTKLARHSHDVDALFAGRHWDYLWTRWTRYGATEQRVLQGIQDEPGAPHFSYSDVLSFRHAMMQASADFDKHFPRSTAVGSDRPQAKLTAFYEANRFFLGAVDLSETLQHRS